MIDYEKKYNEALERAKHALDCDKEGLVTTDRVLIESMFPELQESEDEKIRKALIDYFDDAIKADVNPLQSYGTHPNKVIDWLEKQKAMDKDIIFRPLAGTDIIVAAKQALEKIEIGKEIILAFNGAYIPVNGKTVAEICNEYFSWVEKQGEQKAIEEVNGEDYGIDGLWHAQRILEKTLGSVGGYQSDDGILDHKAAITAVKKLYEQKHADKVEPKFKVGDWIANDYCDGKVIALTDDAYLLDSGQGIPFSCEHNAHLWTIQDAKDGDVLACNEEILLFKSYSVQGRISVYCWYNWKTNNFHSIGVDDASLTKRNKIYPATKEQRDLLFQKMEEEGYQWNAEKKELKKIEESENIKNQIMSEITDLVKDYIRQKSTCNNEDGDIIIFSK